MANQRIFYHARKPNKLGTTHLNPPIFTVGFEYVEEKNTLFITWAKPLTGESYNKKFGIQIINSRLNKMIDNYPDVTFTENMPHVVSRYLNFYINKAKRYFKKIDDTVIYHI